MQVSSALETWLGYSRFVKVDVIELGIMSQRARDALVCQIVSSFSSGCFCSVFCSMYCVLSVVPDRVGSGMNHLEGSASGL
jgi:hypothetical protein